MLSPVAYWTSAKENAATCITRPIFRLASSILWVISLNLLVKASDFLFNNEWPCWAPFNLPFMRLNVIRVGKTCSLFPAPDMMPRFV